MPAILGLTKSNSRSVGMTYDPHPTLEVRRAMGRLQWFAPYDTDMVAQFPKKVIVTKPKRGGIPDLFGDSTGPYAFSPKLYNKIVEMEQTNGLGPERHYAHKVQVVCEKPIKGQTDFGTYYLMLRPAAIDCVVYEESKFRSKINDGFGFEAAEKSTGGGVSL